MALLFLSRRTAESSVGHTSQNPDCFADSFGTRLRTLETRRCFFREKFCEGGNKIGLSPEAWIAGCGEDPDGIAMKSPIFFRAGLAGWLVAALSVMGATWCGAAGPLTKGQRVFTAGNSFHAWFVAPILRDLAEKAGIQGHQVVGESKIGGSRAIQHWEVPEEKNQAKTALRAGKVDVLTLACMHHPDEGIEKFARLALENNPAARISLQEFWMPWDKNEWPFEGDPKTVDFNAATTNALRALHWPYFDEMDAYVTNLNRRLGKAAVFVAPVGQAVVRLREKVMAGEVPGVAKQSELFTDPLGHPHAPVEALVAYCHFAVIYRRSPVGLPVPDVLARSAKPEWRTPGLNLLLQEIAWEQALAHPLSGVGSN
jgi:hypothetical protein